MMVDTERMGAGVLCRIGFSEEAIMHFKIR